ncbi:hypothetical protein MKS88_000832 [Plasmodium brasilianum]|uniref:Uncharacterized protein n=1 Tax=Plasmodium brasilianum TaxID=5824 RepID=A0ACB9YF64_PLABR|nr:hypothetical protein MKS88_000832 [Plasmodium brasilianum]
MFNISFYENYHLRKKLDKRTYRLLSKYKPITDSSTVLLKEQVSYNEKYEEKDKFKQVSVTRGRNKHPTKCSLNNIEGCVASRKSKSPVCRRDSYFGKRILDKIYYKNNVRCATTSDFNFLKRCKKNKIYFLYALFIAFVVRAIIDIGSLVVHKGNIENTFTSGWSIPVQILSFILTIIFIITTIYICRNIKKYDKMLNVKSKMNNSLYRPLPKMGF